MRMRPIADNAIEWLAFALGVVPKPIVETFPPIVLAQSIIVATQLGIFVVLAEGKASGAEVAQLCQTDPKATQLLLAALTSAGYVHEYHGRYALTGQSRRWLVSSATDVSAYIEFTASQWDWLGHLKEFIYTGAPLNFHEHLTATEWGLYQRGMRSIARLTLPEVVWRIPFPRGARRLLDIGGGHSLASATFCRRYRNLQATVLDLANALTAAPIPPADVSRRIKRVAGDVLSTDLGENEYDVIYVANLLHHFDAATNTALASRIAAALRPGGIWIIQDGIHGPHHPIRQASVLGDLYFALTSASGCWSFADLVEWQRGAGLYPRRAIRLVTAPEQGLQIAIKR
jgi:SAM-dependent methyltransferase